MLAYVDGQNEPTEQERFRIGHVQHVYRFARSHDIASVALEHKEIGGRERPWAVTIGIECLQPETRERWIEFQTVWTMKAAREALGY